MERTTTIPGEEDLRRKIRRLTGVRLLLATAVLSASVLYQMTEHHVAGSIPLLYGMIGFAYGVTVLYGFLLRSGMNLVSLTYLQIGVDVFFETALVYFSGGIESPLSFLYILSVIAAGTILYRRGAALTASLASILYGGVVNLQYYRLTPGLDPAAVSIGEAIYIPFLNVIAFFTVAMLAGGLAEQLRRTGERLIESDRGLSDLRVLHEIIVQSISSGLFTTDLEGRLTSFNRAASEITGHASRDVMGAACWTLFDWPEVRTLFNPTFAFAGRYRFDQSAITRGGRTIPVGVTLSPLRDNEGTVIGLCGIFQDLTRIREMEETMRRSERLASIGEMAAGMAHEIRNPLASVSGSMQVLSRELTLMAEHKHLMDIALRETGRLNEIIADFLCYARPRPLVRRTCEICGLLEETLVLAKMSPEFRDSIRLISRFSAKPLWIDADAVRLKQVFWNLVLNAIQSMTKGGKLTVTARLAEDAELGPRAEIDFEDTGVGISPEVRKNLFVPFFTTKDRGSGLGLPIVLRIVEEHGGTVRFKEREGGGSRFTISLPAGQVPEDAPSSPGEPSELRLPGKVGIV